MDLITHTLIHLSGVLVAGFVVWKIWGKSLLSFGIAFVSGLLIDFDHLLDYLLVFGKNFKFDYAIKGYEFLESGKVYVIFHGWEYVLILAGFVFITKSKTVKTVLLALSLGLFTHLIIDTVTNGMPPEGYSVIYRAVNNFEAKNIVRQKKIQIQK